MELLAGPIVGALFGSTLTMILKVAEETRQGNMLTKDQRMKLSEDVLYIERELRFIKPIITNVIMHFDPSLPESFIEFQKVCINILAGVADRIEDCIAGKLCGMRTTTQLVGDISDLKVQTENLKEQLDSYGNLNQRFTGVDRQHANPPRELLDEVSRRNCVLYSCMFPPDHPARRNALIRRWVAEGLAEKQYALGYLQASVRENNIQSIEKSNNGEVKICRPTNGVLHTISQQYLSRYSTLVHRDHVIQQAEEVRRLYFYPNGVYPIPNEDADVKLDLSKDLSHLRHLRTLAIFTGDPPSNCKDILKFSSYEVLRLLDLKKCHHIKANHLDAICDLLLLKYLSFGSIISRIPRKISNLQQLETLDMGRRKTVTVFAEIFWLPKLKHLLGKFKLHPLDFYFKEKKIRDFLSGASVLETLSGFAIGKRRGFPQLMISMTKLKKVKIWCEASADKANKDRFVEGIKKFIGEGDLQHTPYQDQVPALPTKDRSLAIDFTEASEEFLQKIEIATSRLTSLKLCGKLTNNVPPFVTSTHIVELCLSSTNLGWDKIITDLSGLDTLHYLKLIEDNLGPVVIQLAHFPDLQRICLVGKHSLQGIAIEAGALPQLVSLCLNCEAQSMQGITIEAGALPKLVSLHLLSEPLDNPPPIVMASLDNLGEVALYSGVHETVQNAWTDAAHGHRKTPRLSFIPKA